MTTIAEGTTGFVDGVAVRLVTNLLPNERYAWVKTITGENIKTHEVGNWYSYSPSGFVEVERFHPEGECTCRPDSDTCCLACQEYIRGTCGTELPY